MSDEKVRMRQSFLSYARPTLRLSDKVSTTEDWEAAMRIWFDEQDRALWGSYEAGWESANRLLLEDNNLVMFNTFQIGTEEQKK